MEVCDRVSSREVRQKKIKETFPPSTWRNICSENEGYDLWTNKNNTFICVEARVKGWLVSYSNFKQVQGSQG